MASDDKRCEEKNDNKNTRAGVSADGHSKIRYKHMHAHGHAHTHAWPNIFSFDRSKKRDVIGLMFVFYMLVRWGSYFYVCLCVYMCVLSSKFLLRSHKCGAVSGEIEKALLHWNNDVCRDILYMFFNATKRDNFFILFYHWCESNRVSFIATEEQNWVNTILIFLDHKQAATRSACPDLHSTGWVKYAIQGNKVFGMQTSGMEECQYCKSIQYLDRKQPQFSHVLSLNIIKTLWDDLTETETKGRQHPKKSFECCSKSLENYSWRLPKEITRKLPNKVLIPQDLSFLMVGFPGHTQHGCSHILCNHLVMVFHVYPAC